MCNDGGDILFFNQQAFIAMNNKLDNCSELG